MTTATISSVDALIAEQKTLGSSLQAATLAGDRGAITALKARQQTIGADIALTRNLAALDVARQQIDTLTAELAEWRAAQPAKIAEVEQLRETYEAARTAYEDAAKQLSFAQGNINAFATHPVDLSRRISAARAEVDRLTKLIAN